MPKKEINKIPFSQPITEPKWIDIKTGSVLNRTKADYHLAVYKVIKPNDQQKEN